MRFVGIDPGLKGSIALLDIDSLEVKFFDIPLREEKRNNKVKRRLDGEALAALLGSLLPAKFMIEDIWGFGVQHKSKAASGDKEVRSGSTSAFNFACDYGVLLGVLWACQIPFARVSPQKWQNYLAKKGDKQKSIDMAQRMFPTAQLIPPRCRVPSDGRAEALLIACYAAKVAGQLQ